MQTKPRTFYQAGNRIHAESISARARKVIDRIVPQQTVSGTILVVRAKLQGTAFAVIEAQPARGFQVGERLEAELIVAQAHRLRRQRITRGSSTHNIQPIRLRGDAFCVIDRPLKRIRESQ